MPAIVGRLIRISQVDEVHEFVLPGRTYLIDTDDHGKPKLRRYSEDDGVGDLSRMLKSMTDHDEQLYEDAVFQLDVLD
jgi:hypothetical protein